MYLEFCSFIVLSLFESDLGKICWHLSPHFQQRDLTQIVQTNPSHIWLQVIRSTLDPDHIWMGICVVSRHVMGVRVDHN